MLELDKVECAQFEPFAGEEFEIRLPAGTLRIKLAEARILGAAYPGAKRAPFSLRFLGDPALRLPQGIYKLHHGHLGEMDIFIVQTGADATGSQFEVIFN
jgi:hypothetical protein